MIKNLIFDFGKVLVDYDFDKYLYAFIDNPETRAAVREITGNQDFIERCDKGEDTFEEIVAEMKAKYPEWEREFQLFYDRQLAAVTDEVVGMRTLLQKLKTEGYALYGLTNWSNTVYPVMEKFSIFRLLDGQLISSEEKLVKPDLAIYWRLCEKFGLQPDTCLFTDDKMVNVEGALKAGMHAIHFIDTAQFERELRALLCSQS